MDEGFEGGGDIGNDGSSDIGSDTDFGGDLASEEGIDLGGDIDSDTITDIETDLGDQTNGDVRESMVDDMDINAESDIGEVFGDDLNADTTLNEETINSSDYPDDAEAEDDTSDEIETDLNGGEVDDADTEGDADGIVREGLSEDTLDGSFVDDETPEDIDSKEVPEGDPPDSEQSASETSDESSDNGGSEGYGDSADEAAGTVEPKDIPDEYGSSFNDRIKQTPINNGEWSGERGHSTWIPDTEDVAEQLDAYGVDGIEYRDGFPDFSPVTEYEHQLQEELYENGDTAQFNDCNNALSSHLENNPEFSANFDDDQLEAIRAGEKPSGYTWHHDVEPGNMQLVPTRIHQSCGHYGGKNVWGGGTVNRKYLEE